MMKLTCKSVVVLLGASIVSSFAWADKNDEDPIGQLLRVQSTLSTTESVPSAQAQVIEVAYVATSPSQTLDHLLQNTKILNDAADPLGRLIDDGDLLAPDSKRQMAVDIAFNYLNTPYKYGGNNAATGFDCSGLVRAIYLQVANKSLPRSAAQQASATSTIQRAELKPGDLVFFNTNRRNKFSHVGIYVGNNKFIHAPRTGAHVRIEDINQRYWTTRFTGARRVALE